MDRRSRVQFAPRKGSSVNVSPPPCRRNCIQTSWQMPMELHCLRSCVGRATPKRNRFVVQHGRTPDYVSSPLVAKDQNSGECLRNYIAPTMGSSERVRLPSCDRPDGKPPCKRWGRDPKLFLTFLSPEPDLSPANASGTTSCSGFDSRPSSHCRV